MKKFVTVLLAAAVIGCGLQQPVWGQGSDGPAVEVEPESSTRSDVIPTSAFAASDPVRIVKLSPDGNLIALVRFVDKEATVIIHDIDSGKTLRKFPAGDKLELDGCVGRAASAC